MASFIHSRALQVNRAATGLKVPLEFQGLRVRMASQVYQEPQESLLRSAPSPAASLKNNLWTVMSSLRASFIYSASSHTHFDFSWGLSDPTYSWLGCEALLCHWTLIVRLMHMMAALSHFTSFSGGCSTSCEWACPRSCFFSHTLIFSSMMPIEHRCPWTSSLAAPAPSPRYWKQLFFFYYFLFIGNERMTNFRFLLCESPVFHYLFACILSLSRPVSVCVNITGQIPAE